MSNENLSSAKLFSSGLEQFHSLTDQTTDRALGSQKDAWAGVSLSYEEFINLPITQQFLYQTSSSPLQSYESRQVAEDALRESQEVFDGFRQLNIFHPIINQIMQDSDTPIEDIIKKGYSDVFLESALDYCEKVSDLTYWSVLVTEHQRETGKFVETLAMSDEEFAEKHQEIQWSDRNFVALRLKEKVIGDAFSGVVALNLLPDGPDYTGANIHDSESDFGVNLELIMVSPNVVSRDEVKAKDDRLFVKRVHQHIDTDDPAASDEPQPASPGQENFVLTLLQKVNGKLQVLKDQDSDAIRRYINDPLPED